MRLRPAVLGAFLGVTLFVARVQGSQLWAYEAMQPMWTDNGIFLGRVTVLTYDTADVGILAAVSTCDSSRVMTPMGAQQHNLAYWEGLRTIVELNPRQANGLFGDTLRVTLRCTTPLAEFADFGIATIVAGTVECLMVNAARSNSVRFVSLRCDTPGLSRKFDGVFSAGQFRRGPRKDWWR